MFKAENDSFNIFKDYIYTHWKNLQFRKKAGNLKCSWQRGRFFWDLFEIFLDLFQLLQQAISISLDKWNLPGQGCSSGQWCPKEKEKAPTIFPEEASGNIPWFKSKPLYLFRTREQQLAADSCWVWPCLHGYPFIHCFHPSLDPRDFKNHVTAGFFF